MRTVSIASVVIALLFVPSLCIRAQSKSGAPLAIEDLMSAKEFEAAGLRKLSTDELRALNTWLRTYTQAVVQTAAQGSPTASKASVAPDLIESNIDGEFQGWEGETIFKLLNGQIWVEFPQNFMEKRASVDRTQDQEQKRSLGGPAFGRRGAL